MARIEFEIDSDTVAAVIEPAMTAARRGRACGDAVRARREQFEFIAILATALNLGIRMAVDLSDADHATIRAAVAIAAAQGLGILPPADDDGPGEEAQH